MIHTKGQKGTFEEQMANLEQAVKIIADIVELDYKVVCTHGNGPQVGNILWQQTAGDTEVVPAQPMHMCGAMSQGQIGYMIQTALRTEMRNRGLSLGATTVISQVVVDKEDTAFQNPSKGIGKFYTPEEGKKFNEMNLGPFRDDAGRGWRLFVASPQPLEVIEFEAVVDLLDDNQVVVAVGGGGIPVVKEGNQLKGVAAVIDKDRASSVLAKQIKAQLLLILTSVPHASKNFNTPDEEPLRRMTLHDAQGYLDSGEFKEGSMYPKVEACIEFVSETNGKAIITDPEHASAALLGKAGTTISNG